MGRIAANGLCIALLALVGAAPGAAQDVESGRRLYEPCAACHGPAGEGNRAVNAPRLAGREDWYLARQLRHFRTRVRGAAEGDAFGQQMGRAAQVLWDEREVRDVAAFIATLPSPETVPTVRGKTGRGQELYAACAGCHGERGEGSVAISAPRLARLDDWYIVNQLKLFKSGLRGAHSEDSYGQQMKPFTDALPDEQAFADVAAYINTLR